MNTDARIQDIVSRFGIRFSDRAIVAVSLAISCQDVFRDAIFDTCHLLIGLVQEGRGVAFHVLENFDFPVADLNETMLNRNKTQIESSWGIDPEIDIVAARIAFVSRYMTDRRICTEHLLMGLMDEATKSASLLTDFGIKPSEIEAEIYQLLGHKLEYGID